MDYTFKTADGTLLGSSEQSGSFSFILGRGDVVPGLDSRIEGASIGDSLSFVVPADEAYGQRQDNLVFTVPRERFEGMEGLEAGAKVQSTVHGRPAELTVVEVTEQEVTLDANHPLAGLDIAFEVNIKDVEEVPEELLRASESHACGCGGDCSCGGNCSCGGGGDCTCGGGSEH